MIGIAPEGARLIPLTQGQAAIVDPADYERIAAFKWCCLKNPRGYLYAVRFTRVPKSRLIRMHREVMRAEDGLFVDHINHDGLDNRRSNLRTCTPTENVQNQRRQKYKATSEFKGIVPSRNRWRATICANGLRRDLGTYETPHEAALAYDAAARTLHGEFACLNFPEATCAV